MNQPRTDNRAPRVILFPGLGTDSRLYHRQHGVIPNLETPNWIPHQRGESLRQYAQRFAHSLDIREPVILGGVSMGGMIALEISRVVPTSKVILIASTHHPAPINPLLKLSEAVSRILPTIALDKGRLLAPLFLGRGGRIPRDDRELLFVMAKELPIDFIRWSARAIMAWPGCHDPGAPVHHVHGDNDWVIFPRHLKIDLRVPGGAHVLNLSHPGEVNDFILKSVAGK